MVEKSKWYRIGDQPRDAVEREWEIFTRNEESDSLQHVGSVSAPTAEVAHTQATKLFGWYATDIWLCPASDVRRYSTQTLDDQADSISLGMDDEERSHET